MITFASSAELAEFKTFCLYDGISALIFWRNGSSDFSAWQLSEIQGNLATSRDIPAEHIVRAWNDLMDSTNGTAIASLIADGHTMDECEKMDTATIALRDEDEQHCGYWVNN
ncbi:hypothetical protein [Microbacterium sp. NPDC055455]